MINKVNKTFCCVRLHGAEQLKVAMAETEWARNFIKFFSLAVETARKHDGVVVKSLGDGVTTAFDQAEQALQAAIDLHEAMTETLPYVKTGLACKIGLASGQGVVLSLDEQPIDYLGVAMDIAERLCGRAHGNALLIHYPHTEPVDALNIHSQAGILQQRAQETYFIEQTPCYLHGIRQPIHSYSIFWQANPGNYLTTKPAEECRPIKESMAEDEVTYFGKVTAFKKERGFGFIQYYTDGHEYKEIYFHMTYVVSQAPIQENDSVQFVIKPGKEGRPQACSVLVMGSRLLGQVESLDANGSGHISIRNQASEVIRFFILPQETGTLPLKVNNTVEFTVGSGSDMEGLVATDMRLHSSEEGDNGNSNGNGNSDGSGSSNDSSSGSGSTGDNLPLGVTEQAVITVYFTDKGYGFAKCRRNNIYVHISELTDPEQIPGPGDLIEFEVTPGRDSTYRANNIRIVQKKEIE